MELIRKFFGYPKNSGLMFLVILCFSIAYMCVFIDSVNAEEVTTAPSTWQDWGSHHYTSPESPVCGYNTYTVSGESRYPWYCYYLDDNSSGILIRQEYPAGSGYSYNRYKYIYISSSATASLQLINNASGSTSNYSMGKIVANTGVIDSDFRTYFPNWADLYIWQSAIVNDNTELSNYYFIDNYDVSCTSSLDLFNKLKEDNFQNPNQGGSDEDLPLLSYTLERNTVPQVSLNLTTTKLNFKWNYTEKEPYASAPTFYTFDIMASANWKQSPTGIGEIFDPDTLTPNQQNITYISNGGRNISENQYSFLYDSVGQQVYSKSNKAWNDDSINSMSLGYILYIRTKEVKGSKVSGWKIFVVQAGGYVRSTGYVMKPDGTIVNGASEDIPNSDDGMDTSNNGTAPYNPDSNTSAQSDPSGEMYNPEATFNIGNMIANLKAIVNSIADLPSILAQLVTFLPEWLISLLGLSIGMIVVIGVAKAIVR